MRVAGILFVLSLGSSLLYGKTGIEQLVEKYDLEPLAESEYWKENPGVLPYEKCELVTADGSRIHGHRFEFMAGFSKKKQPFSLFCFSKKLKVGYQVPLDLKKDRSIGLAVNLDLYHFTSGSVHRLNGKKVTDLFGNFKGFSGGFGVGVSVSGAVLSHNHISMRLNESGSITVAQIGASFRKVSVGSRALIENEIFSDYYLEKEAELRQAAQASVADIENIDEFLAILKDERVALSDWPDSKKYSETYKYWIHHLMSVSNLHHQCQRGQSNPNRQRQSMPCPTMDGDTMQRVDVRKLRGELDPDFLSSLTFKRIK